MSERQILEEGEYCDCCLGDTLLGEWGVGELKWTICAHCQEDRPKFIAWLATEFEQVLSDDANFVKNADGTWTDLSHSNAAADC